MQIPRSFIFLLFLAFAGCATNKGPTSTGSQLEKIGQIDTALKLVAQHRFAEAEGVIQPVIHAKDFVRLPSTEQYRALLTAAKLAFTLKHPKLEYESRVRLLALPEATADDRQSRVNAANRLGDTGEIIIGLTVLVEKNPERLNASWEPFIVRALRDGSRKLPHGSTMPLLQALYAAHWKLKWNTEPSAAWQDLVLLLLERHRLIEAIDVSMHVTEEYGIISMRADRRFDAVVAANPVHFDVDAAFERDLEAFQSAAERAPQSLLAKLGVIGLLLEEPQHYAEALAAADRVLEEVRSSADPKQRYEDYDEQYAWILDNRSLALTHLGRWDEGLEQLVAASWALDKNGENVNQVINLAELYCALGRPEEALNSLTRLGVQVSPYGLMQAAAVRLDAAIQLGDTGQTTKWLTFMRDHRADAPRAYQYGLLRMNEGDTAAKWLIERLKDGDQRSETLLSIQDYAAPPRTPRQAELHERDRDLIARPDVQAEIQKVGRIQRYHLEALGQ
jgi:beta-barrel assembly-enhancing protease